MKKSLLTFIIALALCLTFAGPVGASAAGAVEFGDNTVSVSQDRIGELSRQLETLGASAGIDLGIIYENAVPEGTTAQDRADVLLENSALSKDSIMFYVATESRDWAISSLGKGIEAFDDKAQSDVMLEVKGYLSSGDFEGAASAYINAIKPYIDEYAEMAGMSKFQRACKTFGWGKMAIICVVIGAVVGLIRSSMLKSELKSVREKTEATESIKQGSFKLTTNRDMYLYKTVTRTERPGADRAGGPDTSTTHTSSTGQTHGGSSGKF